MFRTGFWWVYCTQVCTRNYTTISYKGVLIRLITHSFNPTRAQEALEQVISAALVGRASAGNVRGTEVQGTFVTCHGINIRPAHGLNSHNIPQKKTWFPKRNFVTRIVCFDQVSPVALFLGGEG